MFSISSFIVLIAPLFQWYIQQASKSDMPVQNFFEGKMETMLSRIFQV